jgi:acyl-CoA synthetase (NDP forming)
VLVTLLSPAQPTFRSPEAAALALAAAVTDAEWRARPDDPGLALEVTVPDGAGGQELLDAYGIGSIGMELRVTVHQDPTFGPVITLSVGGPAADLVDDRAVSITPMSARDAQDMVWSLRTAPVMLAGTDAAALEDLLLRVSHLVEDVPEVDALELDLQTGEATVRLRPWEPRPDLALRRLR